MRAPFATWRPSPNFTKGGMAQQPRGVVLHIEQGSEAACIAWFQNPASQVSAHFSVSKAGAISQYVETSDAAWAEAAGNPEWISIEHEGLSGESLTDAQQAADASIIAWLLGSCGMRFPLQVADSPSATGLGWHGMGGAAWGNHPACPGSPVLSQRPHILALTEALLGPAPSPPGGDMTPELWHDGTRYIVIGIPGCSPFLISTSGDGSVITAAHPDWKDVGPLSAATISNALAAS